MSEKLRKMTDEAIEQIYEEVVKERNRRLQAKAVKRMIKR